MEKQHSALEIKCQEKTLRHKKKHIWICGVMEKQHSALEIKCQEKTLRHKKKHIWIISDIRYNNQILSLFSKIFQTQGR